MIKDFSIVIPIYNIEDYIKECINSVIKQKYDSYEIILVNDGSTDGCHDICMKFKSKYPDKIVYIKKKNEGLSSARNVGIKAATGRYLVFLDGDDYWIKDVLSDMHRGIKSNPDVVIGNGFICEYKDYTIKKSHELNKEIFEFQEKEEAFLSYLQSPVRSWTVWEHLYNTDFIKKNNLYFKTGILCEDVEWTYKVILKAKTLGFYKQIYYHYRADREGSIMYGYSYKRWNDLINSSEKWFEHIEEIENVRLKTKLAEIHTTLAYSVIRQVAHFAKEERLKAYKTIMNSHFINYPITKKEKKKSTIIKMIGIKNYVLMIRAYEKTRMFIKKLVNLH